MVKRLKIEWAESADELEARYKKEKQVERRTRLLALWHLRQGKRIDEVVQLLSVSYRTVQNWLRWYRHGGLEEVLQRIRGHGSSGAHSAYLTALQQRALFTKVQLGAFRTVWDAVEWVQARWGWVIPTKGCTICCTGMSVALKCRALNRAKPLSSARSSGKKGASRAIGGGGCDPKPAHLALR